MNTSFLAFVFDTFPPAVMVITVDKFRLHLGWYNNAKQKCRRRQNYDVTVVTDII